MEMWTELCYCQDTVPVSKIEYDIQMCEDGRETLH